MFQNTNVKSNTTGLIRLHLTLVQTVKYKLINEEQMSANKYHSDREYTNRNDPQIADIAI